jgi:hypothetical protein
MSRIRGVFPLFLATTFGIVNGMWIAPSRHLFSDLTYTAKGIWVFGPAFKEQQQEKDDQAK